MAWEIRRELKKKLTGIKFNVRSWGGGWYEVIVKHPTKTVNDCRQALSIMDMIYEEMASFEADNEIFLTVTI